MEEDAAPERLRKHCQNTVGHIESKLHIQRVTLTDKAMTTTTNATTNDENDCAPSEATPSPPLPRNITLHKESFWSQGQFFEFELPTDHKIYHMSDIKRWQNG